MANAHDDTDGMWLPDYLAGAQGGHLSELSAAAPAVRASGPLLKGWDACCTMVQWGAKSFVNLVYPPSCLVCRSATSVPDGLCPLCWGQIKLIERPFCERLGTPFGVDLGTGLISPGAFANPPVYRRARAVACFDDGPVRELVHRLKYGDRVELARPMGRWMARAGADILTDADLLIPVPLHRTRLFSRRFNQAALLAQAISRFGAAPVNPHVLKRVKPTAPQVGKSRAQRASNVQGAFQVDAPAQAYIAGKTLLLVDDVLTSGRRPMRQPGYCCARALPMLMSWCLLGLLRTCDYHG